MPHLPPREAREAIDANMDSVRHPDTGLIYLGGAKSVAYRAYWMGRRDAKNKSPT